MSGTTGVTLTVLGCSGTYPDDGGACSGYLVRSPGASLVVDLGAGSLSNLQRHLAIGEVDAVVLSHVHPDHWLDLPVLRNAMRYVLGIGGLPVYGTAETWLMAEVIIGELPPTMLWHTIDESSVVEVTTDARLWRRWDTEPKRWGEPLPYDGRLLVARGLGDIRVTLPLG